MIWATYRSSMIWEVRLIIRLVHLTCIGHHRVRSRVRLLWYIRYPGEEHVGTAGGTGRRVLRIEKSVGHVRLLVQERRGRPRRPRFDVLLMWLLDLSLWQRLRVRLMRWLLLLKHHINFVTLSTREHTIYILQLLYVVHYLVTTYKHNHFYL